MKYNFKRAIGILLVFYIATFVVGIIVGFITSQNMASLNSISRFMWYFGIVVNMLLIALFTRWYFVQKTLVASAKSGALFGLTAVALSTVVDIIIFSVANSYGAAVHLGAYYSDPKFWLIVVLSIGTAAFIGYRIGKRRAAKAR